MKKIVALALCLIMALSLATVAFGATLTGTYTWKYTTKAGMNGAAADAGTITVTEAKAPKDVNKDGEIDVTSFTEAGYVKTFAFSAFSGVYAQVATIDKADIVVYYGDTTTVFGYFAAVPANNPYYYGTGVAFNNFGEKCGQLDTDPVADAKYYSFQDVVYVAVADGAGAINLMVDNKLVSVDPVVATKVAHVPEFTYDKDYKVVGVKCAECGVAATL